MSDEYTFNDFEPEDAWHPQDAIPEQIHNLGLRCVLLDKGPRLLEGDDDNTRTAMLKELIARTEAALQQRGISERARLRAYQILDDVELVLARIRRGD